MIETEREGASSIAPGTMPNSPEPGTKFACPAGQPEEPLNLKISGLTGLR